MLIKRYPSGFEVHGPPYTEAEKERIRKELAQPPGRIMAPSRWAAAQAARKARGAEEPPQEEPSL